MPARPSYRRTIEDTDPTTPPSTQPLQTPSARLLSTKRKRIGALRGLDPENDIIHLNDTQPEHTSKSEPVTRSLRHRNPRPLYSKKFHPMDSVVRPKRAAKQGYITRETVPEVSEEEDNTSLASGSGSEVPSKEQRRPYRASAHKPVLYNEKIHPQDDRIPKSDEPSTDSSPPRKRRIRLPTERDVTQTDMSRQAAPGRRGQSGTTRRSELRYAEGLDVWDSPKGPMEALRSSQSSIDSVVKQISAVVNHTSRLQPSSKTAIMKFIEFRIHEDKEQDQRNRIRAHRPVSPVDDFPKENTPISHLHINDNANLNTGPRRYEDDIMVAEDLVPEAADDLNVNVHEPSIITSQIEDENDAVPNALANSQHDWAQHERTESADTYSTTQLTHQLERHRLPSAGDTPNYAQRPYTFSSSTISQDQVHYPSSDVSSLPERTIKDTHLTYSQSEALNAGRSSQNLRTQNEYEGHGASLGVTGSYDSLDDSEHFYSAM